MAARVLQSPLPTFNDLNGSPLTGGYLYFGDIDTDPRQSPLTVYWDEAKTIPATQPIRTTSGYPVRNGAPADVWIDGNCSILVLDSQSRQVSYVSEWIGGSDVSLRSALAASSGSGLVGFIQAGTGAVSRSAEDKEREILSVFDFMTAAQRADVTGNTLALDHTAAVQAAINTGKHVDLQGYQYKVHGLTQSTSGQAIFSSRGIARLIKNANGAILTSTGDDFMMENVNWQGDAAAPTFTGDGVISTGQRPSFINCAGHWISGVPLIATRDRVRVKGTCGIYQTTDTSATGWDIVIGASGTATLYHELDEVYTGQATGGIKLIDTGSHTIKGGLFGKLYIAAGTKPAGANGGKTIGARITGNVTVEQSNAIFTANQFSVIAITFAAGTAQCTLDSSNVYGTGATVTNNGSSNNLIEREVSGGGTMQRKYGDDTSTAVVTVNATDSTQQFGYSGSVWIPNNQSYRAKLASGTLVHVANMSSGDALTIGNLSVVRTDVGGPTLNLFSAAGTQAQVVDGGIRPVSDNTKTLGTNTLRWSTVHAFQVKVAPVTVANLPSAGSAAGTRAFVSDATATTFASIVAGGGANNVPVYSDGTSWRIG